MAEIDLLSVVALLEDVAQEGLIRGEVAQLSSALPQECTKSNLATTLAKCMHP